MADGVDFPDRVDSMCLDKCPADRYFYGMGLSPEETVAALVLLGLGGVGIYRFIRWIMDAPLTRDPWGEDTEEALNSEMALPLCHHCLTPQDHNGWFCPECGATVGPYCNYLPYVYIFAQGEVLRAGVKERLRHTPLITIGYILFSVGMFAFAAPIYWFFLFRNLRRRGSSPSEPVPA